MTIAFRCLLIAAAILALVYIVRKIRHEELEIANATFWFLFSAALVLIAAFPQIVFFFSDLLGIESPANFVFLAIVAILVIREFFTTVEIARLRKRLVALAQYEALHRSGQTDAARQSHNK